MKTIGIVMGSKSDMPVAQKAIDTLKELEIPFLGLYGACSTMAEGLITAAMFIEGGFGERAAAVTSSHFSTAERQFRYPLSYGGQRTPTSQWTCTAAGAAILSREKGACQIVGGCIGRIADMVAKRLQLQERIGQDIADILEIVLQTNDVAVVIEGKHACMTSRGVKKDSITHTSTLRGKFRENAMLRAEMLNLIKH